MSECQFCKKVFSSTAYLKDHQKRTKKCLKIQQETNDNIVILNFECSFCQKSFLQKKGLNGHLSICKEKKKTDELSINDRHQKEIESLKQQLEAMTKKYDDLVNKMAERSTTTINSNRNTYNHGNNYAFHMVFEKLPEFNEENIRNDYYQKVDRRTFKNIDQFVADHTDVISPYVMVFDESRGKVGIKEEGCQPKDLDSEQLVCKTMKIMKSCAEGIVFDEMEKVSTQTSILDIAQDMKRLNKMNSFILNSASGVSDRMTKRIGKEVCKKGFHTNVIKN